MGAFLFQIYSNNILGSQNEIFDKLNDYFDLFSQNITDLCRTFYISIRQQIEKRFL